MSKEWFDFEELDEVARSLKVAARKRQGSSSGFFVRAWSFFDRNASVVEDPRITTLNALIAKRRKGVENEFLEIQISDLEAELGVGKRR